MFVDLGAASVRWVQLKAGRGLLNDEDVATLLLDV